MAKSIHSMIRVLDLDRSVRFYHEALRLDVADKFDFEGFTLVYLRNAEADFELELTLNKGRTEPYDLGDGYGHLALVVDDARAERERIAALGFNPADVKEMHHDGALMARFFFVQDPDGYKIEILEKHGRFK